MDDIIKTPIVEPVVLSEYRLTVEAISKQVRSDVKVDIKDIGRFAKEAVAVVSDEDGNVISPAQFGCIQLTPELKFFPIVGGS